MNIPKDWKKKKLKSISTILFSNVDKKSFPEETPVMLCNYMDVYNNEYITSKLNFMQATAKETEIKKFKLYKDDVIITKDSETQNDIAVPTVVAENIDNLICGYHLAFIRPNKEKLNSIYLMKLLQEHSIKHEFIRLANGITRFGLSTSTFKNLYIPLPPLPEQQKIAEILSTWDKAIETTTKLIQAKKTQKKALMQSLMNDEFLIKKGGKKVKLGKIAEINMGQSPSSINYNENKKGSILIQGNADIKNRKIKQRYWTTQITKECEVNDIILTVRAPVGAVALSNYKACIGRGVCAIRMKEGKQNYLYHWLVFFENKWKKYEQGSTFTAINSFDLKKLKLVIPPLEDQTRIAEILTTADKEIETLEKYLSKLQEQKKGLMQQLLTGKKRVVV
ncbi:MAG: restriction endonuclease subunit S [Bacteroidales bacterium]|nr:restriction endonuclease subunit S [Bacteroidales bacterium]